MCLFPYESYDSTFCGILFFNLRQLSDNCMEENYLLFSLSLKILKLEETRRMQMLGCLVDLFSSYTDFPSVSLHYILIQKYNFIL